MRINQSIEPTQQQMSLLQRARGVYQLIAACFDYLLREPKSLAPLIEKLQTIKDSHPFFYTELQHGWKRADFFSSALCCIENNGYVDLIQLHYLIYDCSISLAALKDNKVQKGHDAIENQLHFLTHQVSNYQQKI